MSPSRGRLVALVVLLVTGLLLGGIAIATGGDDERPAGKLDVRITPAQISIYVKRAQNTEEQAEGRRSVTLECLDSSGSVVHRSQQGWPFGDTDGGSFDPHSHVGVREGVEARVERCRLVGTGLEGGVSVR